MIVGFNLKSIEAKVFDKKIDGPVNVNTVPSIESMEKKDIGLSLKDILAVTFNFKTTYEPRIGEINISGEVLYQSPEAKEILKKWTSEKKLDEKLGVEVLNAIMRKCMTKAIEISDELRLPPPIQFPIVTTKQATEGKKEETTDEEE
ncbi:MAG: hypothetical protein V1802_00095 [Candidatus Aenigmatarchaeota archaeon]